MSGRRVRLRMYRVGFGDCLLVTFPGPLHLLVDCGSAFTPGGRALVRGAVGDLVAETGGHVHAVVATHRHRDHVSGFADERARLGGLRVDEVWLPWTEDPGDEEAQALARGQSAVARDLAARLSGPMAALARDALPLPAARDLLLDGFQGRPRRRFLKAEGGELHPEALPGVHVRVLAPSRSAGTRKRLELETAIAEAMLEAGGGVGPFAGAFELGRREAVRLWPGLLGDGRAPEDDLRPFALDDLAYWLDRTVNNTSLVLLVRCGAARLLLAGDAQWEGWLPVLQRGELAAELAEAQVYKASHHGSFGGTPQRVLERLGRPLTLVSTGPTPWPELPRRSLLRALAARGPVARSDGGRLPPRVRATERWLEVELRC